MNEPDWKDLVLQSLEQRDAHELASADIYDAYVKLATAYATLRVEGSHGIPLPATPVDEQTSLKAQVAELYKTQNTHLQTIKSLESGLSSIQEAEQRLKQELTALRERRNDLELRAVLHGETLREKNQQIQVLQDELLATGISLNVLEAKAVKLQEENKELLERWLAKVKADADGMNEANQFLEQIRGMRMSSPTSTGEEAPLGVEETARDSED